MVATENAKLKLRRRLADYSKSMLIEGKRFPIAAPSPMSWKDE
jgi:hypothetical protein